jgi:dihydrofolate reductase
MNEDGGALSGPSVFTATGYFLVGVKPGATMRQVMVFNNVSLDGYFVDAKQDMSWAHQSDPEWAAFTADNAKGDCVFVFGRVTYDMMAAWWPTPQAIQAMPDVANRMNQLPKVVFSKSLKRAAWNNTQVIPTDPAAAIRKLKQEPGDPLLIMGSGSIVAQLTSHGLIDEYQIVVHPLVLGDGRTLFDGVQQRVNLRLTQSRAFKNGSVFLRYERAT